MSGLQLQSTLSFPGRNARGNPRYSSHLPEELVRLGGCIRRLAISAVAFAIVALPASRTDAAPHDVKLASITAVFTYGELQQEPSFSISASPNPANPGDSVTVSFSSSSEGVRITGCAARLDGNVSQGCTPSGDVWSTIVQVPGDDAPGPTDIEVGVAYVVCDVDGCIQGDMNDTIPFEIRLPPTTTEPPTTTGPPNTTGPPTTAGPPNTTGLPSGSPIAIEPNLSVGLLIIILVLVLTAVGAVVRRWLQRKLPGTLGGQVQARVLAGLPAVPRIEELGNRSAWVVRVNPQHDPIVQRIEEAHR